MRKIPRSKNDLFYIIHKIGFGLLRGIFRYPFFKFGSNVPILGRNIKFLSSKKIDFGRLVVLSSNGYFDACCQKGIKLEDGVTIREFFWIQCRSGLNKIGKGLHIKSNTYIGPFSKIGIGGFVEIGSNCQIGSRFSLNAEEHTELRGSYTSGEVSRKGIKIGNDVWIGDNVTILDGVTIGNNCVIGANSLVNKNLPNNSVSYGVPCKEVRKI
tara:strand:- start:7039 stop:7674 length:636 start_codon:yes stop_codon:yes gene_type:complete